MRLEKIKAFFKKLNYKSFILVFFLLYAVMPIVPRATSSFLTTYFYMVIVVAAFLFTFFTCRLGRIKEYFFLMLPFVAYSLITMTVSKEDTVLMAGYYALLFVVPVSIGYYLCTHEFYADLYAVVLILAFTVTVITTIIGCIMNPDAARALASADSASDPTTMKYAWLNLGGYSFVYSAVLFYPFVILGFKMKKLNIVFVVIFVVLAFALAVYTEYTFALMLLMISSLLFFVRRTMSVKRFIILMLAAVAAAVLLRYLIAELLTYIGNMIGNATMTEKMTAIFLGREAVENLDDPRDALYMLSIKTFLKNPLFGVYPDVYRNVGGHSFILDNLAQYGLVGGILTFFMYRGIYRIFYKPFVQKIGGCFVFWLFLQPIILSTLNTKMWLDNLCLFAPIMLFAIYQSEEKNEDTLDRKYPFRPARLAAVSKKDQRSVDGSSSE